mgnify:CR=1 FL=1
MLQEQFHQAQMTISNQEIEIERLKTTVIALNGKCTIVEDVREDLENKQKNFGESEEARAGLQTHITVTSEKIVTTNRTHTEYQE